MKATKNSNSSSKTLHVQVAEKLIEQLKAGTAPWQKPWTEEGVPVFQLPYNAITGNRYKGINSLALMMSGYADPRWVTYMQASGSGWHVKKGEKGSMIQYVKLTDVHTKRDDKGRPVTDDEGKHLKVTVQLSRPIITSAWVFNAQQVEGIPPLKITPVKELSWDPIVRAEQLVTGSGAVVRHKPGDDAYYNTREDAITLPLREQFETAGLYYATLLHELGHWTGHPIRLDRDLVNTFGSEGYAREELRAEIASLLIGEELHIGHDPTRHAAYVGDWIKILEGHPFEIHAAAADAEKIFKYLIALERKQEVKADQQGFRVRPFALETGDVIPYKEHRYQVLRSDKTCIIQDQLSGKCIRIQKEDGLYRSLVQHKAQSMGRSTPQQLREEKTAPEEHHTNESLGSSYHR